MITWFPTHHPAAVIKNRTRNLRTWLHDCWKLGLILRGKTPDPEPIIIIARTQEDVERETAGWTHFAYDLETSKEDNRVVYCAAVSNGKKAVVIDCQDGGSLSWFQPLFKRPSLQIVQNGAFDIPIFEYHGINVPGDKCFDTMIAGYTLHPDEYVALSVLVSLTQDLYAWKHEDETSILIYNGRDAAYTYRVAKNQLKELQKRGMAPFFFNHMMPILTEIILELNQTGVSIDDGKRKTLLTEVERKASQWEQILKTHIAQLSYRMGVSLSFPLGENGGLSHPKGTTLLYKELTLPKRTNPKTGSLTVDQDSLKSLKKHDKKRCQGCQEDTQMHTSTSPGKDSAASCPGTVGLLLARSEHTETVNHLRSMAPSKGLKNATTMRLYSRFVFGGDDKHEDLFKRKPATAPRTGRLSSRDPNLQNLHWRSREIVVASRGFQLVERDYSQIELKLNAYWSKDKNLLTAISTGDAHLYIAWLCDQHHGLWRLGHLTWPECYAQYLDGNPTVRKARKEQKTPTYGWFYREGAMTMANTYDIPFKVAQKTIDGLNTVFPDVTQWWARTVQKAASNHHLVNPFGRRREFWDIKEEVPKICNFLPQSTAADILFRALLHLMRSLRRSEDARVLLTVHDSILAEGKDSQRLSAEMDRHMSQPFPELAGMVIKSDAAIGTNWRPAINPDTGALDNPLGLKEAA